MSKDCSKCNNKIEIGEVFKKESGKVVCELCLGIRNPYDNPRDYKYFWGGKLVSLDELPPMARVLFPTLDMYKG